MMKILIDNGHGVNTPGKCSPDGSLREWKWTRETARRIVAQLKARGMDAELLVPEDADISLGMRASRANAWCDKLGSSNVVLVSVHNNAAPPCDNKWHTAHGWEAYTTKGVTKADRLATLLYEEAGKHLPGVKLRTDYSDGDPDKEASFAIIRQTKCPAVLTENLFQDNKDEVAFLLSEQGREKIVSLHVEAIMRYCKG